MADWPDTSADRRGSAASTRQIGPGEDANWSSSEASQSNNILLIIAGNMQAAVPLSDDGSSQALNPQVMVDSHAQFSVG